MRATYLYSATLAILFTQRCPVVTAERYAIFPRQETTSRAPAAASTPTTISGASTVATSTDTPPSSSVSSRSASSSGAAPSTSNPSTTGRSDLPEAARSSLDGSAAASTFAVVTASPIPKGSLNITTGNDTVIEGLPIKPEITPALSVAGALMILTGAFYTIVGIKTKWIHVSLSSAYLVNLAVTVLILYVMHPPISRGLQGGYVVAVVLPGIILGAVAIIFKDITEGFACFLGGFCLSMWFLVLKPGGLITNDVGKIIFIALMTIGTFTLYISHHTRPYGLIGSIAFAGATVIVLGIDCFSRAGLKEFWLYIWSLNHDLFPLHYDQDYPITRGIRVELAAIVIITFMGIMSQMKIWKVIRQKREARALEHKRKEQERNLADEEQGRKVEADNEQDRPLWEAIHSRKNKTKVQENYLDSGIGTDEPSTRKSSWGDVRDTEAEGMELQEVPGSQKGPSDQSRVTIHVAEDDFYETSLVGGQRTSLDRAMLKSDAGPSPQTVSETSSTKETVKSATKALDPNLTLQPKVVPPPFKIPNMESNSDDDVSSVAASAPTDGLPDRGSKYLAGLSGIRRSSNRSRHSYIAGGTSEEALIVPHVDDDRASSLAATHDGISDHGDSEELLSYSRSQTPDVEKVLDNASFEALAAASHRKPVPKSETPQAKLAEAIELPDSRPASVTLETPVDQDVKLASHPDESSHVAEPALLSGKLPDGGSKVVTAYRTNEWAKHLDGAEMPEVEDLRLHKNALQEKTSPTESAVPLDVGALQQTPLDAAPRPSIIKPTQSSSHLTLPSALKSRSSTLAPKNPFSRHSKQQGPPPKSQPVSHPLTIAKRVERNPSQTSLVNTVSRTSSQTSLDSIQSHGDKVRPSLSKRRSSQASGLQVNRGHRGSSTPLATTPVVESPIEEGVESSFPSSRFTPDNAHLMSQRDRIITGKPSSTSLLRTSYSNVALDQHPAYRSVEEDIDEIPLAKRRSILQQNPQAIPLAHRSSVGPSGKSTPRLSSGTSTPLQYNPYRSSSTPQLSSIRPAPSQRDSTISAWHKSLKPDTTAHLENQNMEARRADLMREKQRESTSRLEGDIKSGVRASVVDQGMRRSEMLSAHQAAMRKLQGEAKT